MNKRALKRSAHPGGSVFILIIFSLLILVPLMSGFVKWLKTHRRQLVQTQVQVKAVYAGMAAAAETRRMILGDVLGNTAGLTRQWTPGHERTFKAQVDQDTLVEVTVTHEGYQ